MQPAPRGPEEMREAVAQYVDALHRAYVAQASQLPPALQGGLPLLSGGPFTVVAAAAADLHFVATRQPFAAPRGQEVEVAGEAPPLRWWLRFYDPVVLPELGLLSSADGGAGVRAALGVRTWLYHLVLQPGGQLTPHHAGHTGTGLAHAHGAAARDFETIRAHAGPRSVLALEMEGAASAGLVHAQALLARALVPDDPAVDAEAARRPEPDPDALRRAVLEALRRPR